MSEATHHPTDDDAWAEACAEDLAAEKARIRAEQGAGDGAPGSAAEELLKLVGAVADKVAGLGHPLMGPAAQGAVRQFVNQAKSAVEPVIERNPDVFDHLAAAGTELLAAYRSAVEGHESRWTRTTGPGRPPGPRDGGPAADGGRPGRDGEGPEDDGPGPSHRIDLD
ncbi:DUF5304 domain-containing protein [Streptomyces sp. NPDC093225]|uniref:DUF5304 domain-containing protein n=1 Tax=Streptomyces sp. NPDC093225 TaxID=3366034 RepID=UPI00382C27E2